MSNIRPYVIINGVDSRTIQGLLITSLPPISKPAQRTLTETIDGKDGDSSIKLGFSAYDKPLGIALTFNYNVDDIIAFFNSEGTIIFSNEPDKLYNFEIFEAIDFEKLIRFKTATVTIHTQPFKFSTTENPLEFTSKEFTVVNNGNTDSRPNLVITGEGLATMQINGKNALNIDFGDAEQTLLIDSEGMNAYYTNNIKAIEAEIVPKQDLHGFDSPFIDSDVVNKVPYLSRALAGTAERIGNYEYNKLVGGTVAFNQYAENIIASGTYANVQITNNNNGSITLNGTSNGRGFILNFNISPRANHIYILANGKGLTLHSTSWGLTVDREKEINISKCNSEQAGERIAYEIMEANISFDNKTVYPQIIDLTQMLGATVADYIYSLEQATAGAGVAYFKALGFNKDYYPYNAGELMSVKTSAHVTKNAGGAVIQTVALDPNLELRGIPKLDANNKLYYDGDTYSADGSVSRRYGVVDLGLLTWNKDTVGANWGFYVSSITGAKAPPDNYTAVNAICPNNYSIVTASGNTSYTNNKVAFMKSNGQFFIVDSAYSDAEAFKTALSGVYLVYEKAEATSESAEPFNNPIAIDANGSEEFTDSRAVAIPVGHESYYANICDIEGFTEVNLVRAGVNIWDEEVENGAYSIYSNSGTGAKINASGYTRSKNFIPITPSTTYHMHRTHSGNALYLGFYDINKNWLGYNNSGVIQGIVEQDFNFTTSLQARYMVFYDLGDITGTSINYPASDTNYHAYAGEIFKAEFEQEGEPVTVYGGKYNFTTGLLELTHAKITLNGTQTINAGAFDGSASNAVARFVLPQLSKSYTYNERPNAISQKLKPVICSFAGDFASWKNDTAGVNSFTIHISGQYLAIALKQEGITNSASLNNYLANNPIEFAYELNEHIFIELDEQIISALLGINNFYADTGNVTVIFVNDGQDETQTGAIVTFDLDESDLNKGDLANRLVSGNYANIRLKTGSNAIKFIGSVSAVGLDKYSRWL